MKTVERSNLAGNSVGQAERVNIRLDRPYLRGNHLSLLAPAIFDKSGVLKENLFLIGQVTFCKSGYPQKNPLVYFISDYGLNSVASTLTPGPMVLEIDIFRI